MRCNDPDSFSLIMPTKDRPAFLARSFEFLAAQGFTGQILCVDASEMQNFTANKKVIAAHPSVTVIHHKPTKPGDAWREIDEAMERISSTYVQLHHDDDFYFTDRWDDAIVVLESNADVATAEGRFAVVEREATGTGFSLATHDRYSYTDDFSLARVRDCMARYCHLAFAVTRREYFHAAVRKVHQYLEQGWFDQYALTLLLAACGKAVALDDLYGVRQFHAEQHHKGFEGAKAYKHWPLILAAPDFSATYRDFRRCLLDGLGGDAGDAQTAGLILDQGLVTLVERSAGIMPEREPGDIAVFERCNIQGTLEYERVAEVISTIRRHPGT